MTEKYKAILDPAEFNEKRVADEQLIGVLFDESGIQSSSSYYGLKNARLWASKLVKEDGSINKQVDIFQESGILWGKSGTATEEHQRQFLKKWKEEKGFAESFLKFQMPLLSPYAHSLIYDTLLIPKSVTLTSAHVRRAVVCASLTHLRQIVGSCFATAPAILIQKEYPVSFLKDLFDLLVKGRLTRVIAGVEYSVPVSASWGPGDLNARIFQKDAKIEYSPGLLYAFEEAGMLKKSSSLQKKIEQLAKLFKPYLEQNVDMSVGDLIEHLMPSEKQHEAKQAFKLLVENPLLRAWEFTLASFIDVKKELSGWNISLGLGLDPEVKSGIGSVVKERLELFMSEKNTKLQSLNKECLNEQARVQTIEALARKAATESEMRRFRSEYEAAFYSFQTLLNMRDDLHKDLQSIQTLFEHLLKSYQRDLSHYFQEIYDPELKSGLSWQQRALLREDTPVGFRLVCTHGRENASVWTPIQDKEGYSRALVEFFSVTEPSLVLKDHRDEIKNLISQVTSEVIAHVRSEDFIKGAVNRAAKYERSPWSYISGGSMGTLLTTYFNKEKTLTEESRWIEDEVDLLVFLIDTLKSLPPSTMNGFIEDPDKRMLMHSPAHAFLLQPGWPLLSRGWSDRQFTYTWVRDEFVLPGRQFYDQITLSTSDQEILKNLAGVHFPSFEEQSVLAFAKDLKDYGVKDAGPFLYSHLPLTPNERCQAVLQAIVKDSDVSLVQELLDQIKQSSLTATQIRACAKELLIRKNLEQCAVEKFVIEKARLLGISPTPFLFADTNWVDSYFACVVNPATNGVELWTMDRDGIKGVPMTPWDHHFKGLDKRPWVIYTNPSEYSGSKTA